MERPPMSNLLSLFEEFEEASAAQQAEIAIAVKVQVTVDVSESELLLFR